MKLDGLPQFQKRDSIPALREIHFSTFSLKTDGNCQTPLCPPPPDSIVLVALLTHGLVLLCRVVDMVLSTGASRVTLALCVPGQALFIPGT